MIYYLVVNQDGAGQTSIRWNTWIASAAVANAPIYCWVDSAMDHGIVGGSLKSQKAQIDAIGRLALRVLRGEAADSIPASVAGSERQAGRLAAASALGHQRSARAAGHARQVPRTFGLGSLQASTSSARSASLLAQTAADRGTARSQGETATGRGAGARRPGRAAHELRAHPRPRRATAECAGDRALAHCARAARRHQPAGGAAGDRSRAVGERSRASRQQGSRTMRCTGRRHRPRACTICRTACIRPSSG